MVRKGISRGNEQRLDYDIYLLLPSYLDNGMILVQLRLDHGKAGPQDIP
jgi:hypothetical protein